MQNTNQAIDVTNWRRYEEFAEYPVGARVKTLLYCPMPASYHFLRDNHLYLFKLSSHRYPEQFWVEVFAYLISTEMNIPVSPVFVAYDSKNNQAGALIEWFLNSDENYIAGGDYCQQYIPNFDRKKGKQHNFETIAKILDDLNKKYLHSNIDWKNYWAKTFVFDALIGNTDRHQENWGTINTPSHSKDISNVKIRMSPIFDNGTSMGHEIFSKKFKQYDDSNCLEKYVSKGWHHMKWSINDTDRIKHIDMLRKFTDKYPETRQVMLDCLKKFNYDTFKNILDSLTKFDVPVKLTTERAAFMLRLLQFRYKHLLYQLEK